ncbi:hypothetical protein CLOM_g18736 [Closterium sp. NIES-68]|nr:hypothetical protein CLOM_g18736 [Closterium sp. NIES-68]GJP74759.1 hypothetical protein CLOP_g5299 [Closterium sp. NIES-67]
MASEPQKQQSVGESLSAQPSRTIFIAADLRDPLHVLRCGLASYMPGGALPTYSDLFLLLIEAAPHLVERLFAGAAVAGANADVAVSDARQHLAHLCKKARRVTSQSAPVQSTLVQSAPGQSTLVNPGQRQANPVQVAGCSVSEYLLRFNSAPQHKAAALKRERASRRKNAAAAAGQQNESPESDAPQPVVFRLPNVLEIMAATPAALDGLDFSKAKSETVPKFGWGGARRGNTYEELAAKKDTNEQPSADDSQKRKSRRAVGSAGPGNTGPGTAGLGNTGLGDHPSGPGSLVEPMASAQDVPGGCAEATAAVDVCVAEREPVGNAAAYITVPVPVELVDDEAEHGGMDSGRSRSGGGETTGFAATSEVSLLRMPSVASGNGLTQDVEVGQEGV